MVGILVSALAVGLGNFAVSISIGLSGVGKGTRWRVGAVFCLFEAGMPLVGLVLGNGIAGPLGGESRYLGGGLLILMGIYPLLSGSSEADHVDAGLSTGRIFLTGLALSLDNLVVGFSLGIRHQSVFAAVIIFGAVTLILTTIGLEFGARLGTWESVTRRSEWFGSGGLVVVGILMMLGML